MPWKGIRDPYLIWLSEIILQQTRVEQGLPYFEKFKSAFPTVLDLAAASDDEVMKLWEGLGYYSRARNLLAAARKIAFELNGTFPTTAAGLLQLPGVGPYTAAAIASFAFDEPQAVLDGNVFRVLARFLGISEPIDAPKGKALFAGLAQEMLDDRHPARYNQALMDFGALQCTPQNPNCNACPLSQHCSAFATKTVAQLPCKSKRIERTVRYFHYIVASRNDGSMLLQKRTGKDIWEGLYQFPLAESEQPEWEENAVRNSPAGKLLLPGAAWAATSKPFKQQLTHQTIIARFWKFQVSDDTVPAEASGYFHVSQEELKRYALPRIIDLYLQDQSLYLNLI